MKNIDKYFDEIPANERDKIIKNFIVDSIKKKEYKNVLLCPLKKHDAVNCLDILDDFVIYGTIMGNVYLCRVDKNNLLPKLKKENLNDSNISNINNSNLSNKNATINDNKTQNKIDDSSRISCIKLDSNNKASSNNNSKLNKNEIIINNNKNKNIYDSNIIPTTRNIYNNLNTPEINTKRKLLNKNILGNKNNQLDLSIINNQNSIISQTHNSDISHNLIPFPQVTQIITNAYENIPCLSFDTKDKINIAIGDTEIMRIENLLNFNYNDDDTGYKYTRIKNYLNENEHMRACEGTTCLMHNNNFLKLDGYINDYNNNIYFNEYNYENKTIDLFQVKKGKIEMSNYNVPFDFDGDRFLFLDYKSENTRRICVYYTLSETNPLIHEIKKDFGHISFMKFYSFNKIILCKENKICEIRKIDDFKLLESWEHIGDEIIAMNVFIKECKEEDKKVGDSFDESSKQNIEDVFDNNDTCYKKSKNIKNKNNYAFNDNNIYGINAKLHLKKIQLEKEKINNSTYRELNINIKTQLKPKGDLKYIQDENSKNGDDEQINVYIKNKISLEKEKASNDINTKKNLDILTNNNEYSYIHSYKELVEKNKKTSDNKQEKNGPTERSLDDEEQKIYIITVDKKGNFNKYHKGKIKTLFNLYDIKNIEQNYKDEEFFSFGFPYFVVMNNKYYAISTDHGIFVLSNKE